MTIDSAASAIARQTLLINVDRVLSGLTSIPIDEYSGCSREAAEFVRALPAEKLKVLAYLFRSIAMDTASLTLGALERTNSVDGQYLDLTVTDNNGTPTNGELQESFLRVVEERGYAD